MNMTKLNAVIGKYVDGTYKTIILSEDVDACMKEFNIIKENSGMYVDVRFYRRIFPWVCREFDEGKARLNKEAIKTKKKKE